MPLCPTCRSEVTPDDVNIAEGVAVCRSCGGMHRLSRLIEAASDAAAIGDEPPPGCRVTETAHGVHLLCPARCVSIGAFMTLFTLFWNAIVSVFLLVLAGAVYTHVIGPLPSWAPLPDPKGKDGEPMSVGATIFLAVFLFPFVLVGAVTAIIAAYSWFGRVEADLSDAHGEVRSGVGRLRWTRRFDATRVRSIQMRESKIQSSTSMGGASRHRNSMNSRPSMEIVIEADREIHLGRSLTETRRTWLAAMLRALLLDAPRR
ncbi:MAG: hypothetical protein EA379_08140 [Phycisphaerales bacterium]|nr:MAG: hypothetical protein EA379_08140 [Phycisphaerales bacterium]